MNTDQAIFAALRRARSKAITPPPPLEGAAAERAKVLQREMLAACNPRKLREVEAAERKANSWQW